MRVSRFDNGHQPSTARHRAPLRAHYVSVATWAHYCQRARRGDGVAGLSLQWPGIETGFGCVALGEATRQGSSHRARPLRPRMCTTRDGVPNSPARTRTARRRETLVARRYPVVGPLVARYAGNFEHVSRRRAVSPRPPVVHRPPRFRGHGYHAPCMTRPVPAHASRTPAQPPSGWRPTRCRASDSTV